MATGPFAPPEALSPAYFEAHGYPHDHWTELRETAPVARHEEAGREAAWLITRHDDITAIERDAVTFINGRGVTLMPDAPGVQEAVLGAIPMMLTMDPPKHGKYRGVVRERFRASAMEGLTEEIIKRCQRLVGEATARRLDQAEATGGIDFVTEVAARLPLDVILALLGVPAEDRDQMFEWSNQVIGSEDPDYSRGGGPMEARNAIFGYFARFVAARRARPGDDLVSLLVTARIDGAPLPDLDVLGFCFMLALAGNETTRNASSGALLALLERPDQMARLRADPGLTPSAVEELLRWVSPIIYMARTATKDVELHGVRIAAGEKLALVYASANRDADKFADPFDLDLSRTPNDHLAFGFGRHQCLGNALARIELSTLLGALLRRYPTIELAGPVARLRSNFVGGIKHLPVRLG